MLLVGLASLRPLVKETSLYFRVFTGVWMFVCKCVQPNLVGFKYQSHKTFVIKAASQY